MKLFGKNPDTLPSSFDLSVESPFFNRYASSSSSATDDTIIIAISSLPAVNATTNCKNRCGQRGRCVTVVLKTITTSLLHVRFMCTPDPAMILSTIYPTGLDSFDLSGSDEIVSKDGGVITHVDIIWQGSGALYVVVYISKTVSTLSFLASNDGSDTTTTSSLHEVHVWKPDWQGGSIHEVILTSNDLAAELLTLPVQQGLFGGNTLTKPQVSACLIQCIFPVDSTIQGKLVLFLSFTTQIKGWISPPSSSVSSSASAVASSDFFSTLDSHIKNTNNNNNNNLEMTQAGYTLHGIITWCDSNLFLLSPALSLPTKTTTSSRCASKNLYFVPCPYTCATDLDPTCSGICNAGLDRAILLGNSGTFIMHENKNIKTSTTTAITTTTKYLFLPSANRNGNNNNNMDTNRLNAQLIAIDPFYGIASTTPIATFQLPIMSSSDFSFSTTTTTTSSTAIVVGVLGTWTRLDIFSALSVLTSQKSILDTITHSPSSSSVLFGYFFQANPQQGILNGQWLQEVRPSRGGSGWQFLVFKSQQASSALQLNLRCTHLSCGGCSTARLRLLCHAAQDCTLSKCIGTVVQTHNSLCGLGELVEKTSLHAIVTWRAILAACIEMSLLAMRGLSGEIIQHVTLRFPTDQFYALVCSCKDMFAGLVGVGMSIGNTLGSSFSSGSIQLNSNQDVGILIGENTLKSASMGGLLFNLVSSATLLPTLALHRWLICLANSSQAAQSEGSLHIQFGDVSMDTSWLPCARVTGISDILNNDDILSGAGNAVQLFVTFTLTLMSGIGDTILFGMQLSFDSTIDYITGLIWNIQDILFAFNLRACKIPNYAQRYVMQCACGDTPYAIPQQQRSQKALADGAMWCVGTLSMPLVNGKIGIIYNPYSLNELSQGVRHVTQYIQCLNWSSVTGDTCVPPASNNNEDTLSMLQILTEQAVEPVAVWARCKSNYLHSTWDIGAGVLFSGINNNYMPSTVPQAVASNAEAWAASISPDFLACLKVSFIFIYFYVIYLFFHDRIQEDCRLIIQYA